MADIKADRYYTEDHEWALKDPDDDGVVVVGITDYAQSQLGDVVMVELPEVDDEVELHGAFGTVESPKSVADLFAPVAGVVVAVNEALEDEPELVNSDCYGRGWIAKIRMQDASQLDQLLGDAAYGQLLAGIDD